MLDYWIALEALFVTDSLGEISFRARTRVARFVAEDRAERKAVSDMLSRSYDRRSKIIHGDAIPGDLPALTDDSGDLLRRVLRRVLELDERIDRDILALG